MPTRRRPFWETYFRTPVVLVNGVELPQRDVWNFIVDSSLLPEDDEVEERTNIPLPAILYPGGAVGSMQFHKLDGVSPIFGGTPKLVVFDTDTGDVKHTGAPLHDSAPKCIDGSAASYAQPLTKVGATSNATQTAIAAIDLPSSLGDCFVHVHALVSYSYVSSGTKGGTFTKVASFKRSSGTLTRIAIEDQSPTTLGTGTAPGGVDVAIDGNEEIDVLGTGIAATNITWITSLHVQVAVVPA